MQQMDLFKMNAHGDLWEEPDLFQQGDAGAAPLATAGAGRVHVLTEWRRCDTPDSLGRIRITAECRGCTTRDPEMGATFIARAETERECWQIIEGAHDARRQATGE